MIAKLLLDIMLHSHRIEMNENDKITCWMTKLKNHIFGRCKIHPRQATGTWLAIFTYAAA